MNIVDIINQAFQNLFEKINLQKHQENFCECEEDLVFFGGGAKGFNHWLH